MVLSSDSGLWRLCRKKTLPQFWEDLTHYRLFRSCQRASAAWAEVVLHQPHGMLNMAALVAVSTALTDL